jgi:hypothetical protein
MSMRRMANMLLCLVLLLGVLLPAFGASPGCEHKCCHTKKSSVRICCQVVPVQAEVRVPHGVRLCATSECDGFQVRCDIFKDAIFASVRVHSSPPLWYRVLRI